MNKLKNYKWLTITITLICVSAAIITIANQFQKENCKSQDFRLETGQTKTIPGGIVGYNYANSDEIIITFFDEINGPTVTADLSYKPLIKNYEYKGKSYAIIIKKQNRTEGTGYYISGELIKLDS
jgi:hypothetical protein